MKSRLLLLLILSGSLLAGFQASAEEKQAAPREAAALPKEVQTILQDRCVKCHGGDAPKAKLDLASADGISRGGRRGTVVSAGKPAESMLWKMIREDKMPPKEPLAETERTVLREWIEKGAAGVSVAGSTHWAFRPLARPKMPKVHDADRARTEIDRFIEEQLEENKLMLGPEADRATLIRRVSFDLIGLPPTLAEVDAFLADQAADAYERMVERYLASPQYGGRWGKYWLDAAGYADSNGYFSADSDRPLAYRYRDYVIRSFNDDKPYDQFVREQLAGDEMVGFVPDGDVTPAMTELLTATHFLRNAPDGTGESDGNPDEVRTDRLSVLEGNLQNCMNSLLGITIQCARCHDHKFEPVTQEEYYRLQAILYPVYCPDRWTKPNDRVVAVASKAEREEHQKLTARVDRQVKALKESLQKITQPFRDQLIEERLKDLKDLEPAVRDALLQAVNAAEDKRTEEQKALLKKHEEHLKVSEDDLAKRFKEYGPVREQILNAVAAREKERPAALETLAVLVETDPQPLVHHLLVRGQHNAPGKEVQPGVPASLWNSENGYHVEDRPEGRISTGRRTALARWVTSKDNRLFARVMVNRIWQHHFGVGLAATPDNLGQSGAKPSHPELLDYLATEFNRSGWSVKAVHRLILKSAVYRQESKLREEAFNVNPDNRLLWRFPLRRLDAEALRDAMLAVSGELDPKRGGPFVPTHRTEDGSVVVDEKADGAHRRSVYLQQRRTQVLTMLELFDAPSMVTSCGKRTTSTVPLQSLALLNSDFARARASALAGRLERDAGAEETKRMDLAFRLTCGRPPNGDESDACKRFLAAQKLIYANEKDMEQRIWTDLCQMIMASNAFLYVE
jgi:mono/diheme cytochrome c family protein